MAEPPLAGYRLGERLAVGGMAEVFRAHKRGAHGFSKAVAIKRVLPHLARDPDFVAMFLEEARLAAQLSSEHLVQVFDFGEDQGAYFLVMEFVDGVDLSAILTRHGRLDIPLAVHVARELCLALGDLHQARDAEGRPLVLAHRDVTPANVLVSGQGAIKLGDFGIAKARARRIHTNAGALKGKLAYLSPEQARGDPVDGRTDIYGLGLTLFEALHGVRYLSSDSDGELLDLARHPETRLPSDREIDLPAPVQAVLQQCLAPQPVRRFQDAASLDRALAGAITLPDQSIRRQALGALVQQTRCAATSPHGTTPTATSTRQLAPAATLPAPSEPPASPPTERFDPLAHDFWSWTARPIFRGALIATLALLALTLVGLRWLTPRPTRSARTAPARSPLHTGRLLPVPTPANETTPSGDANAPTMHTTSPPASPPPISKRSPVTRTVPAPENQSTSPALPNVDSDSTAPRPEPQPNPALRTQLDAVASMLQKRGLLPTDVPELYATLETLRARADDNSLTVETITQLSAAVQNIAINRPFIDAKLRRLNRQIAQQNLTTGQQDQVRQSIREVLSLAVTARYDQANRALNQIIQVLRSTP